MALFTETRSSQKACCHIHRGWKWMDNRLGQWKGGGTFTPLDLKQAKLTNCHTVVLVSVEIEIDPDANDEFFP